jgi:hypothetical protein
MYGPPSDRPGRVGPAAGHRDAQWAGISFIVGANICALLFKARTGKSGSCLAGELSLAGPQCDYGR